MKTSTLFLIFITLSLCCLAQRDKLQAVAFGFSPSVNYRVFGLKNEDLSWIKRQHDSTHEVKLSCSAFINYEFGISERKSFFVGIAYSNYGYQHKDQTMDGFRSYRLNFHYLQFPLGCNFYKRVNEKLQLVLQPALVSSVLLKSRAVYRTNEAYALQRTTVYPGSFSFAVFGQLAIGLSVRMNQNWNFRTQFCGQFQINPLTKGELPCRLYSSGIQMGMVRSL
jgi:hypothetical protein